jgi:hypothetical protein
VATHVIAEIETKMRMRDQLRVAAHQWQDRAQPNALLWRGEVLADLERWTRHTSGAVTTDDKAAQVWDARTKQRLFTLPHGDTMTRTATRSSSTSRHRPGCGCCGSRRTAFA